MSKNHFPPSHWQVFAMKFNIILKARGEKVAKKERMKKKSNVSNKNVLCYKVKLQYLRYIKRSSPYNTYSQHAAEQQASSVIKCYLFIINYLLFLFKNLSISQFSGELEKYIESVSRIHRHTNGCYKMRPSEFTAERIAPSRWWEIDCVRAVRARAEFSKSGRGRELRVFLHDSVIQNEFLRETMSLTSNEKLLCDNHRLISFKLRLSIFHAGKYSKKLEFNFWLTTRKNLNFWLSDFSRERWTNTKKNETKPTNQIISNDCSSLN